MGIRKMRREFMAGICVTATLAFLLPCRYWGNEPKAVELSSDINSDEKHKSTREGIDGGTQQETAERQKKDALAIQRASADPTNRESAGQVEAALADAKNNNAVLDANLIADAGKKFIEASSTTPAAWEATQHFLSYRSFLDNIQPFLSASIKQLIQEALPTQLYAVDPKESAPAWYASKHMVSPQAAARYEPIGSQLNEGHPNGPEWVLLEARGDTKYTLDGSWLKNIAIRNAHIIYHGGRTRLENVYFLGCTFDLELGSNGQKLANRLLTETAITFSSPGTQVSLRPSR